MDCLRCLFSESPSDWEPSEDFSIILAAIRTNVAVLYLYLYLALYMMGQWEKEGSLVEFPMKECLSHFYTSLLDP